MNTIRKSIQVNNLLSSVRHIGAFDLKHKILDQVTWEVNKQGNWSIMNNDTMTRFPRQNIFPTAESHKDMLLQLNQQNR